MTRAADLADLRAEASQLRAELWGLCNGNLGKPLVAPVHALPTDAAAVEGVHEDLRAMTRERDAAWARCEALESKLEIERLTARVCATEAVEVQEISEARTSELLEELSAAESENAQLRQMLMRHDLAESQSALLREIHNKVLASLYQGEELRQQLRAATPTTPTPGPSPRSQQLQVVRGSAMTPLQPCDWFETQGTPCSHHRQLTELTERLRLSHEELREYDSDRVHWARCADDLEKTVADLKSRLSKSEEHTMMMLKEHAEANEKRRQTAEELAELRDVCQQLESAASHAVDLHHSLEDPAFSAPAGAKLKHAIRRDDSAVKPSTRQTLRQPEPQAVPMLPPPKVVRMADGFLGDDASSERTNQLSNIPSAGLATQTTLLPLTQPQFQSFLDASVDEPRVVASESGFSQRC